MEGLRRASLRWSAEVVRVPLPIRVPSRHHERSNRVVRERPGHLPPTGQSPWQASQALHHARAGVCASLAVARASERVRSNPLVWLSRKSQPQTQSGTSAPAPRRSQAAEAAIVVTTDVPTTLALSEMF